MDYPFDISYSTAHPELTFWTPRPSFDSVTYNSTDGTLDFMHTGSYNGIMLFNDTPPVTSLTFGAEISFTENVPVGGTNNYFGLWAAKNPGIDQYGIVPYHKNNSSPLPAGNGWVIDVSSSSGVFAGDGIKFLDGTNGTPAFAAGVWYDVHYEYFTYPLSSEGGYAVFRIFVNGIQMLERQFSDGRATGVTPGFFGYNSKYKVRRIYGSRSTPFSFELTTKANSNFSSIRKDDNPPSQGKIAVTSENVRVNYVYSEDMTIHGRMLNESFQPSQEFVFAYETTTMRPVNRVASTTDGVYAIDKLDSKYNYTVMVMRDGRMTTLPFADYVGYGELAGSYRIRGESVGAVEVKVYSEQTGEYLGMVMTDVNGQFSIPNVNKNHQFALVFREPSGLWEDRVSSRRLPEVIGGTLSFVNTIATNGTSDGVVGSVVIVGGRQPYDVTVTGLPLGLYQSLSGNTITLNGTTSETGTHAVTISVVSIDDFTGSTTFDIVL